MFFFFSIICTPLFFFFFFFNDTATPEIYTLPLPHALPISHPERGVELTSRGRHNLVIDRLHSDRTGGKQKQDSKCDCNGSRWLPFNSARFRIVRDLRIHDSLLLILLRWRTGQTAFAHRRGDPKLRSMVLGRDRLTVLFQLVETLGITSVVLKDQRDMTTERNSIPSGIAEQGSESTKKRDHYKTTAHKNGHLSRRLPDPGCWTGNDSRACNLPGSRQREHQDNRGLAWRR